MTTLNTPIPALSSQPISGLNITVASNTTLAVSAGNVWDSTNTFNMYTLVSTTIDATVNGLNGLDTGTFVLSTQYYVYMIGDDTLKKGTGFVLSASATAPTLPFGYGLYKLIGFARSDASVHFLPQVIIGNKEQRKLLYATPISVLSAGNAQTLTNASCAAALPVIDNLLTLLNVTFTPNVAADSVTFSSPTGYGDVPLSGSVTTVAQKAPLEVLATLVSSVPNIAYINSAATGASSASVVGFTYTI